MRTDEEGQPLAHRIIKPVDPLAETMLAVDELIRRGQAIQDREAVERARKRLQDQSIESQQAAIARANALAEHMAWRPVQNVVLFEEAQCQRCGRLHHIFRGFEILMRQRSSSVERMVATSSIDQAYPTVQRLIMTRTQVCVGCINDFLKVPELRPPEFVNHRRETPDAST